MSAAGSFKTTGTYLPTYHTKQRNIPEEGSIDFVTKVQRMRRICVSTNDSVSVHGYRLASELFRSPCCQPGTQITTQV